MLEVAVADVDAVQLCRGLSLVVDVREELEGSAARKEREVSSSFDSLASGPPGIVSASSP